MPRLSVLVPSALTYAVLSSTACKTTSAASSVAAAPATVALPIAATDGNLCPRFVAGSYVAEPPALYSKNGVLNVSLAYQSSTGPEGTRFCFTTPDNMQSPTLHLNPGDTLKITLTNKTPTPTTTAGMQMSIPSANVCGNAVMNSASVNMHFHGTNVPPTCHQDEVIYTSVNPGDSFTYSITIPADEPPGLYWYHPHIHGFAEAAVQGGASGALIIDGLQNIQAAVANMPARTLLIRDNLVPGQPTPGGAIPSWDLSLNYIPLPYPNYPAPVIAMQPGQTELWRVGNLGADAILDLQVLYDGAAQPLQIVAIDGVPTGSQDGEGQGVLVTKTDVMVPPAARVEFLIKGPNASVANAILQTSKIDTGPLGDNDVQRTIAKILPLATAPLASVVLPAATTPTTSGQRFLGLTTAAPSTQRKIFFSEVVSDPTNPASPTNFYITVDGQTPTLFSMGMAPEIVTTQGAIEDWTIENRAGEDHVFHIHQIHFLVLEKNGVPVPSTDAQYLDTIVIPYYSGTGPYPSIKVRMDFRGAVVGDFVYHCHILQHEDQGMMAIIRVLPPAPSP